jgi:hypothetical protein
LTFKKGIAIDVDLSFTSHPGATGFKVTPVLPPGLSLDPMNGALTGTPAASVPSATYTVSASKGGVTLTGHLVLTVQDAAPSPFTYDDLVGRKHSAVPSTQPKGPYWAGGDYSIAPALPAGLSLNRSTGAVSGAPVQVMPVTEYTVKVRKGFELATAILRITVHDQPPVGLTYFGMPDYIVGVPAADRLPLCSGGRPTAFAVTPPLPAGLTLDPASGLISGTPQVATAEARYTVTASNAGGSTTYGLILKVEPALQAPTITLAPYLTSGRGGLVASIPYLGFHTSYAWTIEGGRLFTGATSNSIQFSAGDPGALKVSVTVKGPRGTATAHASALIVPAPMANLTVPTLVHPGDAWLQAKVSAVEGMTYHWSLLSCIAKPEILSGQGTASLNLSTGNTEGTFDLRIDVQNQAGDHAHALWTIKVQSGIWVTKATQEQSWITPAPVSATPLPDGRVLVVGGQFLLPGAEPRTQVSAALFDANRGVWTATELPFADAFLYHTATLVRDREVLVVGETQAGSKVACFDAGEGAWKNVTQLKTPRRGHTATLLQGGDKVLVVGGRVPKTGNDLHDAECYDLEHDLWTVVAPTLHRRNGHTATLLENGHVLVAGGLSDATGTEVYDPTKDRWTLAGQLSRKRVHHTATRLPNGTVLVAGGEAADAAATAEVFTPGNGKWTLTGSLRDGRRKHTASLLGNGKVMVVGGQGNEWGTFAGSAEVYDPGSSTWERAGSMKAKRVEHGTALLKDGTVLAVLGVNADLVTERYMIPREKPKAAPKAEPERDPDEAKPAASTKPPTAADYLLFGIDPSRPFTAAEVKKTFRVLARQWHPDKHTGADKAVAEEKFKAINAAYESILSRLP